MPRIYQYISGDSHLEVPCDAWTPRVPARYRDRAPRRIRFPNGGDGFVGENSPVIFGGTGQWAGKDPEEFNPMAAVDFATSAGCGSPMQRIGEQDEDGIDAELLFPSNTAWKVARGITDLDAYLAVVRAYNEYLAEEYCVAAPDRLIGVGVMPGRGLQHDLDEMEHCKKIGLRTVGVGRYPGGKSYPTPDDDRFWAASLDTEMPLCIHTSIAHGRGPLFKYPEDPGGEHPPDDIVLRMYRYGHEHSGSLSAVQLVLSGVFDRFPKLHIYWAENQVGWIPFFYQQMDSEYEKNKHWVERVLGLKSLDRRPSEYLREHAYWGFYDDPAGMRMCHEVGTDRIIWGSDFPHIVTQWPHSRKMLDEQMATATADEKRRMVAGNLIDFLHLPDAVAA